MEINITKCYFDMSMKASEDEIRVLAKSIEKAFLAYTTNNMDTREIQPLLQFKDKLVLELANAVGDA